jgi:hypothetical protein
MRRVDWTILVCNEESGLVSDIEYHHLTSLRQSNDAFIFWEAVGMKAILLNLCSSAMTLSLIDSEGRVTRNQIRERRRHSSEGTSCVESFTWENCTKHFISFRKGCDAHSGKNTYYIIQLDWVSEFQAYTVHSESLQTSSLFPCFVSLQPYSLIDLIGFFTHQFTDYIP